MAPAPPVGSQLPLGGHNATTLVYETGRPARIDSYANEDANPFTVIGRTVGQSAVGAPVSVAGRLWGVLILVTDSAEPLPAGTEERLAGFTELVATAIANSQARGELSALADEQAALRRVGLVAGSAADTVFAAVSTERLFGAPCALLRYDHDAVRDGRQPAGAVRPSGRRSRSAVTTRHAVFRPACARRLVRRRRLEPLDRPGPDGRR
jgi:hypothetical protein